MFRKTTIDVYKSYKNSLKQIKCNLENAKNLAWVRKLERIATVGINNHLDRRACITSQSGKKLRLTHKLSNINDVGQTYFKNFMGKSRRTLLYGATGVSVVSSEGTQRTSYVDAPKSAETAQGSLNIEGIPEPPPVPDLPLETIVESTDLLNQLNALGEPTLASLGLGGWTPVGIVQQCLEYFHVGLGVDWWVSIVIGTIIIRFAMFPLVVLAQRNAAKMNNYLPQMQIIQMKMTEARQTGNAMETARYSQELMLFMKEKGLNPFKNMIVPLAQMPVFISFFMGLRGMANVPVESLRSGGLWWFTDLTIPDQYFLMPIITSATLWATIELGADSAKLSAQNMQVMKYVLRGLPIVMIPFTINFPGAVLCYWVSTNFISLIQVGILRIPSVRDYFKIDPLVTHNPDNLPMKPKGFTEGLRDSWTNIKISKELEERRRLDEMQFQRAGKGPIVKTYKFDPTKHTSPLKNPAISAKKQ